MASISLSTRGPTRRAMPLALVYSSRRLLAEKSSDTACEFSLVVRVETLAIRASMVTATLKEIPGYCHTRISE
jgi:hypothetical protein